MKKIVSILLLAVLVPLFVTTSCREYEDAPPPAVDEYSILKEYMKTQNLDITSATGATNPNLLTNWVRSATLTTATPAGIVDPTNFSVPGYTVLDLRTKAHYDLGHIKEAINVTLPNILTAAPADKTAKILVVCYTGQAAARGVAFLRMSGYANAVSLKWGMSCWHAFFRDPAQVGARGNNWNATGNTEQLSHNNWNTSAPVAAGTFTNPVLNTGKTTGAEILAARIAATITSTTWSETKGNVLNNPSNYFINNRWPENHRTFYGGISPSYRINSFEEGFKIDGLNKFNPQASTLITYCYTGQTSSMITAWLQVLGFNNAKSLSFGANGIIWSNMHTYSGTDTGLNVKANTWKGTGSASEFSYGYWVTVGSTNDGLYVAP